MNTKYIFVLPAYKPDFFKEALDSILGQTYKDFDLIILDDCSPYDLKSKDFISSSFVFSAYSNCSGVSP